MVGDGRHFCSARATKPVRRCDRRSSGCTSTATRVVGSVRFPDLQLTIASCRLQDPVPVTQPVRWSIASAATGLTARTPPAHSSPKSAASRVATGVRTRDISRRCVHAPAGSVVTRVHDSGWRFMSGDDDDLERRILEASARPPDLWDAVASDDASAIDSVATADIDQARDLDGHTLLSWAAVNASVRAIGALLERGASPNLRLDDGGTPFLAMLEASPRMVPVALEVAKQFLAHGADPSRAYEAARRPMTGFSAMRAKKRVGWSALDVVRERVEPVAPDLASSLAALLM